MQGRYKLKHLVSELFSNEEQVDISQTVTAKTDW